MMNRAAFVSAIVVAAGGSTRMGQPKQQIPLGGVPVLTRAVRALAATPSVAELVVVARESDIPAFRTLCAEAVGVRPLRFVPGGETRQQSVAAGIAAAAPEVTHYAIHDGARPLLTAALAEAVIREALESGAATAAVRVKDTVKLSDETGHWIEATPDRARLWAVQTPQVFERTLYETALRHAAADGRDFTDDCQLAEYAGYAVRLVEGDYANLKITTPEDVAMAEGLLRMRGEII